MTGKQKIEGLTNAWLGFELFSGLFALYQNGLGIFSLLSALVSTALGLLLVWFIGRRLLAKSGFWRVLLIALSAFGAVAGTFATGKLAWHFVETLSFGVLVHAGLAATIVYMNARSFRVLTDKSVKTYFAA